MSTSSSRRHKKEVHDHEEESAARTRPLSYEEIMLRRKDKKLCDNVVTEATVENVSEPFESGRGERWDNDLAAVVEKPLSEEPVKESSGKKERYSSKSSKTEDDVVKGRVRRSNEPESLKDKPKKDTRSGGRGDKTDREVHGRRKIDKDSIDESVKKQSRDYSTRKERHLDSRGEHERETKRKYQHENDEKIRDRNAAKKHDPGKLRALEFSERKERKESSKSHFEESRRKRGRSWSRDRGNRHRLRSLSPRAHKHASNNLGPRSDVSSHSLKDRTGRQHLGIDSSRVSSNGSSSHYQRHDESANRLGGYSPRKRRTESAIKTPSPPNRSPEKKKARWDPPLASTDKSLSSSVASRFQSSNSNVTSNIHGMAIAVSVASTTTTSIPGVSPDSILTKKNASIDSVQLTQATRRMRRLHVENIPSTTSESTLVESLNNFLLSSGVNHIQGTRPCISCVINKEKGQALVEFLTPEDALAALAFDGTSFFGSILKIRRPKDFIDVATGDHDPEKSVAAADGIVTISDVVNDSPNKIFIGGISKVLSSEMLLEIVSVFGPLKAYHFEANEELTEPYAFLEYVDQSVTLKACAGLNGIKLGGRVITVVQAIRSGSSSVNSGNASVYEIPEHAKPLLKQPSHILKLRNVFNLENMSSLSEQEIEEVLEDVRLECARFGMVKSVKIVKHANNHVVTTGACEAVNNVESGGQWQNYSKEKGAKTDTLDEHIDKDVKVTSGVKLTGELKEDEVPESNCLGFDKPADDLVEDKSCQIGQLDKDTEIQGSDDLSNQDSEELTNLPNSKEDASECNDKTSEVTRIQNSMPEEVDGENQDTFAGTVDNVGAETDSILESETKEQHNGKESDFDPGSIFEPGSVFVEFGRTEASWMAAHCLHGRVFEDRIVTVEYVASDHYRAHFSN
uniref:splicing factor U2af large subunit A n=1 Tax=Fragaria vesca subsp. vesca TaxID=101020 RepID=UPI0005C92448|nr:PREDICTED: splicing factor U2af large subunit A [Fragaria vesca subsp. vesca]